MKQIVDNKDIALVCDTLLTGDYKSVIKYVFPTLVVKATWKNNPSKQNRQESIVLTVGQPNYLERIFIKQCKKAEVPFQIRKVQLKYYPKKKK